MASPQAENGHVRIANELYEQIMQRPFTKRQRSILDLIIRLSYGFSKKTAYIPSQKYFEVVGVGRKKVSSERRELQRLNVIGFDVTTNVYWVIKDYDQWDLEKATGDVQMMFTELLKANLHSPQNGGEHTQNEGKSPQNGVGDTPKTGANSPPKRGRVELEIHCGSKDEEASKTIESNKYKNRSTTTTDTGALTLEEYVDQIQTRMQIRTENYRHTVERDSYKAAKALYEEQIPLAFVLDGIDESFNNYTPKGRLDRIRNFAYCAPRIEQHWIDQQKGRDSVDNRVGGSPRLGSAKEAPGAEKYIGELIERRRQAEGI